MEQIIRIFLALITIILSTCRPSSAQFISSGSIEYVKTTNMHLSMKLEYKDQFGDDEMMNTMLKMIPKITTKIYKLTFDKDKSYFTYLKDGPEKMPAFGGKDPASENKVIKNFSANTYQAEKEVFDQILMVKDSIPKYEWKIHDELRQINGYLCRKATTVLGDSMVVVAFYSDEIIVNSGPESFGGLPGMILGLAVPRLYSTWFATKVEIGAYDPTLEKPFSKKAKDVNLENQADFIKEKMSDWGAFGQQMIYKLII